MNHCIEFIWNDKNVRGSVVVCYIWVEWDGANTPSNDMMLYMASHSSLFLLFSCKRGLRWTKLSNDVRRAHLLTSYSLNSQTHYLFINLAMTMTALRLHDYISLTTARLISIMHHQSYRLDKYSIEYLPRW